MKVIMSQYTRNRFHRSTCNGTWGSSMSRLGIYCQKVVKLSLIDRCSYHLIQASCLGGDCIYVKKKHEQWCANVPGYRGMAVLDFMEALTMVYEKVT